MADTDTPTPMTDADVTPPPAGASFEPAAPLKDAGVEFAPEGSASGGRIADAKHAVAGQATSFGEQAADRARQFVEDGKEKAGGLLDQLAQMLTDAAGQVDEKLGGSYGEYARTAASTVQGFAESVRSKDVDELADDVRGFIRKSPGAAVGVTAALGFALARVVHAGLEQRA